ncbi:probable WRKY transcription factor 19 [Impatiens glandulifera]|uniref:probable WRKY transcription factor 19 n=1 Tax=Impatiens glandulifera TaxID=253017 RepID=UPI001FB1411F|nr:probable WRKY transcription factor 19 [Impatiens glandulifera]
MDIKLQDSAFVANSSQNAFKNLGNSVHLEPKPSDSLDCSLPFFISSRGMKRKRNLIDAGHNVGLFLGLGQSSGSSTISSTLSWAKESDVKSSMELDLNFSLHLGNNNNKEKLSNPKTFPSYLQPKVDLMLSMSTGPSESDVSAVHTSSSPIESSMRISQLVTKPKRSVTCTSGISQSKVSNETRSISSNSSTKACKFEGCGKGARGASGLCIAHGGGRRCQKLGCLKGAEGRTVFCKAHGGGRRCEYLGCTKSAEGRTDFCIAHGGGRRCNRDNCSRAARGKSGFCIRHGGGKRCREENCTKSAEGLSGLCISHGGGRRCQFSDCTKGAQGSTMFCKAHGGGKRCTFFGCNKGAEGSTPFCKGHGGGKRCSFRWGDVCCPKSVHGGTLLCVAHGGGKRCAVVECTKSARGRTDYCVRHGGGKRCQSEGCGKSAQGSTDFCKAHGGGKRCCWGEVGSGLCNSYARNKGGLCGAHAGLVHDKRVHGSGGSLDSIMVHNSKAQWMGVKSCGVLVPEGRVHGGSLMALLSGSGSHINMEKKVSSLN